MGAKATKPEALYAWDEKADRLAVGSFGSVYKAAPKRLRSYEHVHVAPSAVAIKVVGTRRMAKSERIKLHREFEILRTLKHAHIVQFLEIFEEKSRLTLVFELMEGGRLDVRLRDSGGRLCEAEALATLKTLCLALDYLHRDMHIVHRDLKPENLLYASRARTDADLRLCDFGFARHLPTTSEAASTGGGGDGELRMRTVCGSPEYVAPEVLRGNGYSGTGCDMWSAGVMLHLMLSGTCPFVDDGDKLRLYRSILQGKLAMEGPGWQGIREETKGLVAGLLELDVAKRRSARSVVA